MRNAARRAPTAEKLGEQAGAYLAGGLLISIGLGVNYSPRASALRTTRPVLRLDGERLGARLWSVVSLPQTLEQVQPHVAT